MLRVTEEEAVARGWIKPDTVITIKSDSKNSNNKKTSTKKTISKREIEGEEQASLIAWFSQNYPNIAHLLIHIPNGGYRKNAFEGWRLKQQGVRKGVSDLFLAMPSKDYHGLWVEFKAAPPNNAKPSEEQLFWLSEMKKQGYAAHLCLGEKEAKKVIIDYINT